MGSYFLKLKTAVIAGLQRWVQNQKKNYFAKFFGITLQNKGTVLIL